MDRSVVYVGEILLVADFLRAQEQAMIGLADTMADVLGVTSGAVTGLAATPGTGLTVSIAAGRLYQLAATEAMWVSTYSLNAAQILKQGISTAAQTLSGFAAPGTNGQSINYLIEAQYQDSLSGSLILPYYNSANPSVQYSGPGNSGSAQSYLLLGAVALQVKAGAAATTGTQTTPSADSGWIGLYSVTVAYGQSSIGSANIAALTSAPFLAGMLNSHHGGVAGQAPQIKLASEVQGQLPMANLYASDSYGEISAVQAYAGNPNGVVAGNAAVAGVSPPSLCYDTTESVLWVCTGAGTTSTAVWVPVVAGYVGVTWCGTSGGSANAQTLTPAPVLPSYTSNIALAFIAGYTNTGALTMNVSGLGAKSVYKDGPSGPIALTGGEVVANEIYTIRYDGTRLQLTTTELGTASLKNTGNSIVDPGTGALEIAEPISLQTGANYAFVAADRGYLKRRSNSGSGMSDTLPASGAVANGWCVSILNSDASATYLVAAPAGTSLNGVSLGGVSLQPGQSLEVTCDGSNGYWTTFAPSTVTGTDSGWSLAYQIGWLQ